MNPSKKNKLGKEQLLEKYISGEISREEMHLLNQYAIDDDFLFESLEGLSEFENDNMSSIADLNRRLEVKKKKKKPTYLYWIGAAASLAIIVFSVTLLNKKANESLNNTMVMDQVEFEREDLDQEFDSSPRVKELVIEPVSEPEPLPESIIQPRTQANESVVIATNDKSSEPKLKAQNKHEADGTNEGIARLDNKAEPTLDLPGRAIPPPPVAAAPNPTVAGASSSRAKSKKIAVPGIEVEEESFADDNFSSVVEKKEMAKPQSLVKIYGTVISKEGEPIFGSSIISPKNNTIVISDQDGRFEIALPDSDSEIVVSSLGFKEKRIQLKANKQIEIVLEEEELNTIEVVYFDEREEVVLDTAELVDFATYANSHIKVSDEVLEKIGSDFMILEFEIDQMGKAGNISVIDSLGFGIDEEAIRLIQSYGKWNERTKVQKMRKKIKLFFKGKR